MFSSDEDAIAPPALTPVRFNIRYLGENPEGANEAADKDEPEERDEVRGGPGEKDDPEENEYIVETGKWIISGGQNYFLHVFGDVTEEMEIIEKVPYVLLATAVLGLLISFFAGRLLSRNMLKPIKSISSQMRNISASNLSERIPEIAVEDELQELTRSFNKMIERLEQSFEKQNRFVSDASHELRTPLAVMQGHTSMLLRWGKEDKAVFESSLKTMHAEIRNMTELVEKLLTLAKNDDASLNLRREKIDAAALLQEVVDEARMLSPGSDIGIGACDADTVVADRSAIKQVLRILLDNSVKFCPPPGKIRIKAARRQGGTEISVTDEGIGIDKEKLPHIFERFFRADSSRTKKTGGTGLGLAIAKGLIESHGGTVKVKSQPGKGTQIHVYIPDV